MSDFASVLAGNSHDAKRVELVHPFNHENPTPADRYNLVVIGAGSAGLVTALIASSLGARVALVERELMGGDCLNAGCVPSKGVIHEARMMANVAAAKGQGLDLSGALNPGFGAAMERMRERRARIAADDAVNRYENEFGVDVFLGNARFADDGRSVTVERRGQKDRLSFKKAVIATGARPAIPPVPGLEEVGYRTNETVFNLTESPKRLAVIGGGPIGCELAQAFGRLGSQVTIFERGDQFLLREDRDAADILESAFEREGIAIELGAEVLCALPKGAETDLRFRDAGGNDREIAVDEILVGTGRLPNIVGLNLEGAGVNFDAHRGVLVDDQLRTSNPHIFAAGDVCMTWKFTHAADAAAKIVVQNALFFGRKRLSDLVMPWCTYTSPEIAHVGLYAREAETQGREIDTYKVPLRDSNRAVLDGEEEGFVKIHTKKGGDRILGATIVASHAGDLLSQITQLMVTKRGLGTLTNVIFPYPTQAEVLKRAAGAYTRTQFTPFLKRVITHFFTWSRR